MRTAEAVSLLFILFCRDPVACAGSARMACAGTVVSGNGVEPTPSMRSICVIWRIGGTLVIVRNAMSMHAGTGRSIWLRLGLRLVSMPPPISVRWLNTIAVGGRSITRNTPSMRRSGNVNDN